MKINSGLNIVSKRRRLRLKSKKEDDDVAKIEDLQTQKDEQVIREKPFQKVARRIGGKSFYRALEGFAPKVYLVANNAAMRALEKFTIEDKPLYRNGRFGNYEVEIDPNCDGLYFVTESHGGIVDFEKVTLENIS